MKNVKASLDYFDISTFYKSIHVPKVQFIENTKYEKRSFKIYFEF